jgi:hypothetical protein
MSILFDTHPLDANPLRCIGFLLLLGVQVSLAVISWKLRNLDIPSSVCILFDALNTSTLKLGSGKQQGLVNTGLLGLANTDLLLLLGVQVPPCSHQEARDFDIGKARIPTRANPGCVREARDSLIPVLYTSRGSSPFLQSSAGGISSRHGQTLAGEIAGGHTLYETGETGYENHPIDSYYAGSVARSWSLPSRRGRLLVIK